MARRWATRWAPRQSHSDTTVNAFLMVVYFFVVRRRARRGVHKLSGPAWLHTHSGHRTPNADDTFASASRARTLNRRQCTECTVHALGCSQNDSYVEYRTPPASKSERMGPEYRGACSVLDRQTEYEWTLTHFRQLCSGVCVCVSLLFSGAYFHCLYFGTGPTDTAECTSWWVNMCDCKHAVCVRFERALVFASYSNWKFTWNTQQFKMHKIQSEQQIC